MRGHSARLGPDEQNEIRCGDGAIRTFAGVGSDHADRERMRAWDRILAVQRCGHRNLELLGERDELLRRTRRTHASTGNDDGVLRALEER